MLFFLCLISKSVDAQWWHTNFCNSAKLLWCDEPVWGEINQYSENQIVTYRVYDDYSHHHYTEFKSGKEVIYKFTPTKDGLHHFYLVYAFFYLFLS